MRWKDKDKNPFVKWQKYFCFFPRYLEDTEEWAWLEFVWMRKTHHSNFSDDYFVRFYSERHEEHPKDVLNHEELEDLVK